MGAKGTKEAPCFADFESFASTTINQSFGASGLFGVSQALAPVVASLRL